MAPAAGGARRGRVALAALATAVAVLVVLLAVGVRDLGRRAVRRADAGREALNAPLAGAAAVPSIDLDPMAMPGAASAASTPFDAAFERWRVDHSSLRGTALDGDWGLDARGQLRPSRSLRRRFDNLLLLSGEASPAALARYVADAVTRQAGAAVAAEVLELWQRYVALQGRAYAHAARADDPATWAPALAEHQQARRAALGVAWAEAFYRDEEAALLQRIAAAADALPAAPRATTPDAAHAAIAADPADAIGIDAASLSDDAAQRLAAACAAQAQWAARVAAARARAQALAADPALSPVQRDAALAAWLGSEFSGAEQRRVRALLSASVTPGP